MFKLIVREELDMASADRPTLFINATVLDGSEHMEPQPDMAVAVERGIITWIGPSAVAQAPAGAEVIDLAGAYLMPGLINMHVHLCGSGKPVSAGDAGALMKKLGLYDLTPAMCHLDYTMAEAGGTADFVREYTLASGGPYCDCGYKKKPAAGTK